MEFKNQPIALCNYMMLMRLAVLLTSGWLMLFGANAIADSTQDGIQMFNAKRYKEARAIFEKTLASKQNDPNALYYYALTLQQTGDPASARKTYEQIVGKFPDSGAAVYARQVLGLPARKPKLETNESKTKSVETSTPSKLNETIKISATETMSIYPQATEVKMDSTTEKSELWSFHVVANFNDLINYYSKEFSEHAWKVDVDAATAEENARLEKELRWPHIVHRSFLLFTKGVLWIQVNVIQYANQDKLDVRIDIRRHGAFGTS